MKILTITDIQKLIQADVCRISLGAFDPEGISTAYKTLPLPSKVRVTNLHYGRSIIVVVNDRSLYKKDRITNLYHGAAKKQVWMAWQKSWSNS